MFLAKATEKQVMKYPYSLILLLLIPVPALAYIDPGIGGFLWQGFVAMTVGVAFQVYQFFKGKKEKHGSDAIPKSESD